MNKYLLGVLGSILIFSHTIAQKSKENYVVMVSFDGFRHDYVDKYDAKNMKAFIKNGAAAEKMLPSYPSKTFPNHYSLVTGLYPGHHGLVDNTFYDKGRDTFYSIRQREKVEDPYYYGGMPIWQLAQKNGLKAASYFWVGSESAIAGELPTYYHKFDDRVPHGDRIQAVFDWLNLPEADRPHVITIYFSMVDTKGHEHGPNAPETHAAVAEADSLVGMLMGGLKNIDLPVNVILTSDHGMMEMQPKPETFIYTEDMFEGLSKDDYILVNNQTHAHIFIKNKEKEETIFAQLKAKENKYKAYKKADIPEKLQFKEHPRIGDVLLITEPGFEITSHEYQNKRPMKNTVWGTHGFDPTVCEDMGTIFYAAGPAIKKGLKIPAFDNIHVYPFIADLLGIEVPLIDGKKEVLHPILKK
jgi:predicted AlkP superfamily pyrophosphatase or phosphodiesterase